MTLEQIFGQRVRVALAARSLTRRDAARKLGVSHQAVAKWASGKSFPRSSQLVELAKLTGSTIEWLMTPYPVVLKTERDVALEQQG